MRGFPLANGGSQTGGAQKTHRRCRALPPVIVQDNAPPRLSPRSCEGIDAALDEYRDFRVAGMLTQWYERWRYVLTHRIA